MLKGPRQPFADHINNTGHSVSLENFCIIDRTSNEHDLLINESYLILRDRPMHNFQSSSIPLCLFCSGNQSCKACTRNRLK